MKVCAFTIGCKANRCDTRAIANAFLARGWDVTDEMEYADVYVIDTCAVTAEAERKSRQCVTRALAQNPKAKIYVCGCAAQNDPDRFRRDGVVYVSGTARKDLLASLPETGSRIWPLPDKYEEIGFGLNRGTRSFVKIQDGCDNFCSYCLIPYLRGRSRSRDPEKIREEIASLLGITKEIVLTGVDISSYGRDIGYSLPGLMESLGAADVRIGLGSLSPDSITDGLLDSLAGLKRFCPHFHLSLQSGCAEVLKKMNRHYTPDEYMRKVKMIRSRFPDAGITTDVIAGFPTETEKNFNESVSFMLDVGFADIHPFPYSPRKGTAACDMKPVPADEIEDRMDALMELKREAAGLFAGKFEGRKLEVLFEQRKNDLVSGYSRNYIRVYSRDCGEDELRTVTATVRFKDGLKTGEF